VLEDLRIGKGWEMPRRETKSPLISTVEKSQLTKFLGVNFFVLLPRERSECVEILLERYPKGLAFPLHQHKECEQTYFIVAGEAEITLDGNVHRLGIGGVAYIPRLTDHAIRNAGDSELVYLNVETYPDGYLPNESTWDSHIALLEKRYGAASNGSNP
jgi:mannose-6-phosphate isomerase-like protein (cupin superfamily)